MLSYVEHETKFYNLGALTHTSELRFFWIQLFKQPKWYMDSKNKHTNTHKTKHTYDQEMPQSQTTDQHTAPNRHRTSASRHTTERAPALYASAR